MSEEEFRECMGKTALEIRRELWIARRRFPSWPSDPLHAVAIVNEEAGELTKAVLQAVYEPEKAPPEFAAALNEWHRKRIHDEAIQVAAMVFRLLASLERYEFSRSVQHAQ